MTADVDSRSPVIEASIHDGSVMTASLAQRKNRNAGAAGRPHTTIITPSTIREPRFCTTEKSFNNIPLHYR